MIATSKTLSDTISSANAPDARHLTDDQRWILAEDLAFLASAANGVMRSPVFHFLAVDPLAHAHPRPGCPAAVDAAFAHCDPRDPHIHGIEGVRPADLATVRAWATANAAIAAVVAIGEDGVAQQIAGGERDTNVGLGTAAVAAVEGGEGGVELQLVHGVRDLRHGALLGSVFRYCRVISQARACVRGVSLTSHFAQRVRFVPSWGVEAAQVVRAH